MQNTNLPIWKSLSGRKTEIFREILGVCGAMGRWRARGPRPAPRACTDPHGMRAGVYRGRNEALRKGFGVEAEELWGRHYLFWHRGTALCLIYEVFSPALEQFLGPQRPVGRE